MDSLESFYDLLRLMDEEKLIYLLVGIPDTKILLVWTEPKLLNSLGLKRNSLFKRVNWSSKSQELQDGGLLGLPCSYVYYRPVSSGSL